MIDSVRAAIAAVIEDVGAKVLARRMSVDLSTIYRWGELGGKTISWERFEQLHHVSGDYRPINALCHSLGGMYLPLPEGQGAVERDMLIAIKEFAELTQEVSKALLDRRIDARECARILREGAQAQRAIAALLADVQSMAHGRRG